MNYSFSAVHLHIKHQKKKMFWDYNDGGDATKLDLVETRSLAFDRAIVIDMIVSLSIHYGSLN